MKTEFRQLKDDELGAAYEVICAAVERLLSRSMRQWTIPLPRHTYERRQAEGRNYALVCDGRIAVVLSILQEAHPYWEDELGREEHWWLSTITTAPAFRGRQLGRLAIGEAMAFLKNRGAEKVCLDCVHGDGFLPRYYASMGFARVARKNIDYPLGTFDMELMRTDL